MEQEYFITLRQSQQYIVNNIQSNPLKLVLVEGTAEIVGREMIPQQVYEFMEGERFFIYTWNEHGCKIKMNQNQPGFDPDKNESINIEHHPMVTILNIHSYLQQMRTQALQNLKPGPVIVIFESMSSGKTSLSKTLINYACKTRFNPIFIDLDIEKNDIMCGGVLGACICDTFYPDNFIQSQNKILYFFGQNEINDKCEEQYIESIKCLGQAVQLKIDYELKKFEKKIQQNSKLAQKLNVLNNPPLFCTGCIISFPFIKKVYRKKVLDAVVKEFKVDILASTDDELYNELLYLCDQQKILFKAPRLKLDVKREDDSQIFNKKENQQLKLYFQGLNNSTNSRNYQIRFSQINLFQLKFLQHNQGNKSTDFSSIVAEKFNFEEKQKIVKNLIGILHETYKPEESKDLGKFAQKIIQTPLALLCHIDSINNDEKVMTVFVPGDKYTVEDLVKRIWVTGNIAWNG